MPEKLHYLYLITNKLNSKVYVGQAVDVKQRWRQHRCYVSNNKPTQYIHSAMIIHGIENFNIEIVAVSKTREDADASEQQLISQYDSRNKQKGYNVKPGGMSQGHSEETRKKISAILKKRFEDPNILEEHTERMKKSMFTQEVRDKISASKKGKSLSEEHKKNLSKSRENRELTQKQIEIVNKLIEYSRTQNPNKISEEKLSKMKTMYANGMTKKQIEKELGCSWNTVAKYLGHDPPRFSDDDRNNIELMLRNGKTITEIAKMYKCDRETIRKYFSDCLKAIKEHIS